MRLLLPLVAAFLFLQARSSAQCLFVLNCPAQTDTLCDYTANDPLFWQAPYWSDPVHQTNDLSDAPVDLSVRAIDTCGGTLTVSCLLWLDLDGDGSSETSVRTDTVQGPGWQPT